MVYSSSVSEVIGDLPLEWLAAACKFVVEVPGTIDFSPPYAVRYGGIGIVTKINRSVFVGGEPINGARVEFGDISYFVPELGQYRQLASDRRTHLEQGLPKILVNWKLGAGIRIHVVSDLPFYRGLNVDSAIAIGVAAVLLLANSRLEIDKFEQFVDKPLSVLQHDEMYKNLFQLAWSIEAMISKYRPEGHHLHGSLTSTRYCTVFWRDSPPAPLHLDLLTEKPFDFHPSGWCFNELATKRGAADPLRGSAPSGVQVGELAAFQLDPLLAFDLAAVFIGREFDSGDAYAAHRTGYRPPIDAYTKASVGLLRPIAGESYARFLSMSKAGDSLDATPWVGDSLDAKSQVGDRLDTKKKYSTTAADKLMDLSVVKSIEIFAMIAGLLPPSGAAGANLRNFMVAVDQAQDIYRLLDLSSGIIDEACHILRSELSDLLRERVGVRLMGAGRGGCLLVVAPKGSLAAALPMALERARSGLRLPLSLPSVHWTSFGDGYPSQGHGVQIVQHPKRRFPFRTNKTVHVREWVGGKMRSVRLYERGAWQGELIDFDVVIDFDDKPHVYFRGEPMQPPSKTDSASKVKVDVVKSLKVQETERAQPSDTAVVWLVQLSPSAVPLLGEQTKNTSHSDEPGQKSPKRRSNPVAAPDQAVCILRSLFKDAQRGATTAELAATECIKAAESDSYENGHYLRQILKNFLGEGAVKACGITIDPRGTEHNIKGGGYALLARPEPTTRIALVQRWRSE